MFVDKKRLVLRKMIDVYRDVVKKQLEDENVQIFFRINVHFVNVQ